MPAGGAHEQRAAYVRRIVRLTGQAVSRWLGGIVIGMALGAAAVLLVEPLLTDAGRTAAPKPDAIERPDPVSSVPTEANTARKGPSTLDAIHRLTSEFEQKVALYNLLRSADSATIEGLLDEAEALEPSARRQFAEQAIYARFAEFDPPAAVARIASNSDDSHSLFRDVILSWARTDLDGAIETAANLPEPHRGRLGRTLLTQVPGLDDDAQTAIAERFSLGQMYHRMRTRSAAQADPAGAWQDALLDDTGVRKESLYTIADMWVQVDPLAALEAANALSETEFRERLEQRLVSAWLRLDQTAAMEWVLAMPRADHRHLVRPVLITLARTDPEAALNALRPSDGDELRDTVVARAVSAWAESDPYAAFDWLRSQQVSPSRRRMIRDVMGVLGDSSPEEALSLASRIEDAPGRADAIHVVLGAWADSDVRAVARWIDESRHLRRKTIETVVDRYAEVDPAEAFDWLMAQDASRHDHAGRIIHKVAQQSPSRARLMIDRMPDGSPKFNATYDLVGGWLKTDPHAALRALPRLQSDSTTRLFGFAFRSWAQLDVDAAAASLDEVPADFRNEAVMGVFHQAWLVAEDIGLAETLYSRLTGEERRAAARMLYQRLRDIDPVRAKRYKE